MCPTGTGPGGDGLRERLDGIRWFRPGGDRRAAEVAAMEHCRTLAAVLGAAGEAGPGPRRGADRVRWIARDWGRANRTVQGARGRGDPTGKGGNGDSEVGLGGLWSLVDDDPELSRQARRQRQRVLEAAAAAAEEVGVGREAALAIQEAGATAAGAADWTSSATRVSCRGVPDPYAPLLVIWELGYWPLGVIGGEFVIFDPWG